MIDSFAARESWKRTAMCSGQVHLEISKKVDSCTVCVQSITGSANTRPFACFQPTLGIDALYSALLHIITHGCNTRAVSLPRVKFDCSTRLCSAVFEYVDKFGFYLHTCRFYTALQGECRATPPFVSVEQHLKCALPFHKHQTRMSPVCCLLLGNSNNVTHIHCIGRYLTHTHHFDAATGTKLCGSTSHTHTPLDMFWFFQPTPSFGNGFLPCCRSFKDWPGYPGLCWCLCLVDFSVIFFFYLVPFIFGDFWTMHVVLSTFWEEGTLVLSKRPRIPGYECVFVLLPEWLALF